MCGICGIATSDGAPGPGQHYLDAMIDSLHHRGPDGRGRHTGPGISLGHTRLSIIDIGGGAQPMSIADGRYVLSFNGEIYNYKELRQSLVEKGHRFKTESDTEVILHLYDAMGADFLQAMNGMFAFALWDATERTLLLARDRLGEKPLYYAETPGGIVFASELKALREVEHLELSVSPRALENYLAYGYVPAPLTIYDEVRKLPQGHVLTWRDGKTTLTRYWNVADNSIEIDESAVEDQLFELLDDSIRIRLRSDVPVGSFLSGGIDSTLITARASKHYEGTLQSFTIGFDSEAHDESADAEFTAKFLGTEHVSRRVSGMNLDILPKLVRQFDEPFADPSALPTWYVTREASDCLKVCLSGDGGDELFGGYSRYLSEPLENVVGAAPAWLRKLLFGLPLAMLPRQRKGYGWLERMVVDGAPRYQQKIGVFNPRERADLLRDPYNRDVDFDADLIRRYFEAGSATAEMQSRADLETYLPDDILVKTDRTSMAHALEVRTPFLDHRVVEFAAALPFRYKIRDGRQKWILRKILASLVPAEILERRKRGFGVPIGDWFRNEYAAFVAERLSSKPNRLFDYVDFDAVQRLVGLHNAGQRDFSDRIWALIWFEEWLGAFD